MMIIMIKYVENNPDTSKQNLHMRNVPKELEKFYQYLKVYLIRKVIDDGYVIQEDIESNEKEKQKFE